MSEIYERKKSPLRKFYDHAKASVLFVKNRKSAQRVARGIAENQVAVAALAASVAAGTIGGVATYQAKRAQDDVSKIASRVQAVEADVRKAAVALAQLQYETDVLANATKQGMENLRKRADNLAGRLQDVKAEVRNLPVTPDSSATAERAVRLAQNARIAAQEAQNAAVAAQNRADDSQDEEARQAATEALQAAQEASAAALAAEQEAKAAQDRIDALPTPTPAPSPTPAPKYNRTLTGDDIVSMNGGPMVARNFQIDLPKGRYTVTLTANGEVVGTPTWYGKVVGPFNAFQDTNQGSGPVEASQTFAWGGGVTTVGGQFDVTNPNSGSDPFKISNITLTIQEV